jgi:hypothetical protein
MPSKGDVVSATVVGTYSHCGNREEHKTGYHIVDVGKGRQVALPPDTEFGVVAKWRLPEPPVGCVVTMPDDAGPSRHLVWRREAFFGMSRWFPLHLAPNLSITWESILHRSNMGRDLTVYQPER